MNLYRIDFTSPQGQSLGASRDFLGVRLLRSRIDANSTAIREAKQRNCFAHIIRISGAGSMRRVGIVAPGSTTVGRVNDNHIPS